MSAKLMQVGNGFILILSGDFATGYQTGHLTYMAAKHCIPCTDEQLTELFLERLESMDHSSMYGMGFIVGWLATLSTKGLKAAATVSLPVAVPAKPGEEGE